MNEKENEESPPCSQSSLINLQFLSCFWLFFVRYRFYLCDKVMISIWSKSWKIPSSNINSHVSLLKLFFTWCNTVVIGSLLLFHISLSPSLSSQFISFPPYLFHVFLPGTSPLHLSIAYKNTELTELLLQLGANINQRASGTFFMPSDQQKEGGIVDVSPQRPSDFSGEKEKVSSQNELSVRGLTLWFLCKETWKIVRRNEGITWSSRKDNKKPNCIHHSHYSGLEWERHLSTKQQRENHCHQKGKRHFISLSSSSTYTLDLDSERTPPVVLLDHVQFFMLFLLDDFFIPLSFSLRTVNRKSATQTACFVHLFNTWMNDWSLSLQCLSFSPPYPIHLLLTSCQWSFGCVVFSDSWESCLLCLVLMSGNEEVVCW